MLYDLVKTVRGKEEVVMTDSFANVKSRLNTLRKSYRKGEAGQSVKLEFRESGKTEKFKKEPRKSW